MKDLILIKTYQDKSEADRLRDQLLDHEIAAVVIADRTSLSSEGAASGTQTFFDVKVPAVDVAKTVSVLTSEGVSPLLAETFDESEEHPETGLEDQLRAEVQSYQAKLADMTDKYLRSCAELENVRKRHGKDQQLKEKFGLENLFKDVIPVLDGFEKALPSQDAVGPQYNKNEVERAFYEGMVQLKEQLLQVFKKHGLAEIESSGAFDPAVHHAIKTLESDAVTTETVGEEYARGYALHDRVLRPAMVSVVTPKSATDADQSTAESQGQNALPPSAERVLH